MARGKKNNRIIQEKKIKDIVNYMYSEATENSIFNKYKSCAITKERCDLYKDFIVCFYSYVYDTYLGADYIKSGEDVRGHFDWCFNKVISLFEEENVYFHDTTELYNYFHEMLIEEFYLSDYKDDKEDRINDWKMIMSFGGKKLNCDLDILISVCESFNKALDGKLIDVNIN